LAAFQGKAKDRIKEPIDYIIQATEEAFKRAEEARDALKAGRSPKVLGEDRPS
jgi:hypothetical protein